MAAVPERPYTVLSCSVSLDGYLGGATRERLVLSNAADLARVDAVRADSDAILVGAGTVRDDDPRLLVRDPLLRADRRSRGLPESPVKVTLTRGGAAWTPGAGSSRWGGARSSSTARAAPLPGCAAGWVTSRPSSTRARTSTWSGSAATSSTAACGA